ncbi:glycosyltransferase family 4 protein [Methanobacterium petrolearium]|uniref:glycosyltransferase family 4 protein n=1 Tax=Methanobacterium petrolearium TaxID=710190 RepID=UPI003081A525|nr:hypothetical protein GCM10025861_21900 [Methanobacterium petrolearium]
MVRKKEVDKADAIICVGSKLRKMIIKDYDAQKDNIFFVSNGVDTKKFDFRIDKKTARTKLKILKEDLVIFHAKSFVPNNGQIYLIEAFNKLLDKFPNSNLILAGEGSLKNDLVQLCKKLQIFDKISFLGNVENEDMPLLMAASDVVVIPSVSINELEETSCILALEAMAMQKPVIATKVGGLKDSIIPNFNGILISDRNPDEIYDSLIKLINNPKLAKDLGKNGCYYVQREREWSKIALDTLFIYNKLLE